MNFGGEAMDWTIYPLIGLYAACFLGWIALGFMDGRKQRNWLFIALLNGMIGLLWLALIDWFDRSPWWDFHPMHRWQGLLFFASRGVTTLLGRWSVKQERLDRA